MDDKSSNSTSGTSSAPTIEGIEEERLVSQAAKGDQSAIEALWKRYYPRLVRYFAANVHNKEEAEDLASDTMFSILRHINGFHGRAKSVQGTPSNGKCTFKSYVNAAANLRLKYWIRQKVAREKRSFGLSTECLTHGQESATAIAAEQPLKAMMSECGDPLQQLMRNDLLDATHYALADVGLRSCEQFKALVFHYGCGLQHREIAELLNTRKETVNTRVQEGRIAMRSRPWLA